MLNRLAVPQLVYVSCNPAALARDLVALQAVYRVVEIQPVDLFPQTGHVETVVRLVKR
jgi:tRNA/tmRNA/rRNA uracil-C5-methylase (TrmA/RlmC/RlmD family)